MNLRFTVYITLMLHLCLIYCHVALVVPVEMLRCRAKVELPGDVAHPHPGAALPQPRADVQPGGKARQRLVCQETESFQDKLRLEPNTRWHQPRQGPDGDRRGVGLPA